MIFSGIFDTGVEDYSPYLFFDIYYIIQRALISHVKLSITYLPLKIVVIHDLSSL